MNYFKITNGIRTEFVMKRFFATEIQDNEAILSEEESHHCLQVLRTRDREIVEITDGKGNLWTAEVQIISKKQFSIYLQTPVVENAPNPAVCSLAVSLTKNIDRIEWMLEKATEIGLNEFYPVITHRTERKQVRMDRLEKITVSAMKQSERLWKPVLHEPLYFEGFIQSSPLREAKYIAHCEDEENKNPLSEIYTKGQKSIILIGPEGDFTESEISTAINSGFQPVSLGNARLRVETAALAACTWMNLK